MSAIRAMWLAGAVAMFAACAGYAPPQDLLVGTPEAEVIKLMGAPTGRYPLPDGGERMEYARGPYGRETYMIDLDAQRRVVQWDQVLDRSYFETVSPGMKADDLLRLIGRPSERMGMMRNGQIWSWRYPNNDCLWWQAQIDAQGIVTAAGYGPAPGCDGAPGRF